MTAPKAAANAAIRSIWSGLLHHDYQSTPIRVRNISTTGAMIECAELLTRWVGALARAWQRLVGVSDGCMGGR